MGKISKTKIPTVSGTTQTTKTLDLSNVMTHLDEYEEDTSFESELFKLDDLDFILEVCPKDDTYTGCKDGYCSIYLRIENVKETDFRKVRYFMRCGKETIALRDTANEFKTGYGWIQAFKIEQISTHPMLHISVVLNHDPLFVDKKPSLTFSEQHENMHEISREHGDITLVVKSPEEDDPTSEPPAKKRKLNDDIDGEITNEVIVSSIILRATSPVFKAMLSNNMMEGTSKRIEIQAKSVKDVEDLTYFMSTNKLKDDSIALNLIQLAHYYEMDRLFWKCVNKLIKNIAIHNFVQVVNTFDKYEISKGYPTLVEFAKKNIDSLKAVDDFDQLSHSFRCVVLGKGES